jgi:3alpha(or 20beta)-hydroxysteroid dehydrogenase
VSDLTGRLAGRTAIVTGAARGLGESIARLFAAEGAHVVVTDIRAEAARQVAGDLAGRAHFVEHDVTDEASWQDVLRQTADTFGRPDVLVNNAGIGHRAPVVRLARTDLERVLAVNLVGPILGMKVIGADMQAAGRGSIVNVSSMAGMAGVFPVIAYSASKWGLRGATRAAAIELGRHGVRVNSLHPGGILTPLSGSPSRPLLEPPEPGQADADPELARRDALRTYQPIRRVGRPIEIARAALFLASDESSYCSGTELVVDGGRLAGFDLEREPTA